LVAQDAVAVIKSLLDQIEDLPSLVDEYAAKAIFLEGSSTNEYDYHHEVPLLKRTVNSLKLFIKDSPIMKPILHDLLDKAKEFWFCGPVDNDKTSRKSIEKWRIYQENRDEIPPEVVQLIESFKQDCTEVLTQYFTESLVELEMEESVEESAQATLCDTHFKYATYMPIGLRVPFEKSTNSFVSIMDYPLTHFSVVDTKLAKLLGYSMARMLAMPCVSFIVNTCAYNAMVSDDAIHSQNPAATIMYYRSMKRQVIAIFWETSVLEDHYMARGVDITTLLDATKANETANTDKMLRQWLHSIRNASFKQQAEILQEDIAVIKSKVCIGPSDLTDRFKKVEEGLRTLVYTTNATVGLLDQAMESKMEKCTSVHDFVEAVQVAGKRFVSRDGRIFTDAMNMFELYLDGNRSPLSSLGGIYVKGDMFDLKGMIDELYSNAVKFTAPEIGVKVQIHIHILDSSVQFLVDIEDYASQGMSDEVIAFYEKYIASSKIMRSGRRKSDGFATGKNSPESSSSSCRSSDEAININAKSGVSRIVTLFHAMTEHGDTDVDIRILLKQTGSIHSINFCLPLLAAKKEKVIKSFEEDDNKVVLVVDDSHVVRRIVGKYLQRLNVPFHSCVDGVEALEWFMDNMDNCFGVLTDLEMPRMGGNALIDRLKRICPSMPCMIVSGNNIAVESCPPGAMRAILKPITLEQIQDAVGEMRNHVAY